MFSDYEKKQFYLDSAELTIIKKEDFKIGDLVKATDWYKLTQFDTDFIGASEIVKLSGNNMELKNGKIIHKSFLILEEEV